MFVPPRLVPRKEPPSIAAASPFERHNPHQWGYTDMTSAIKRSLHHEENCDETSSSHTASKLPKPSTFKPPAFQPRESVDQSRPSFAPPLPVQQTTVPADTVMHRPLTHLQPREVYVPMSAMTKSDAIFSLAKHRPSSNLHISPGPYGTRKDPTMMKTLTRRPHLVQPIRVHHYHHRRRRKRSIGIA